ncbi:MAG: hypothetical protein ACI4QM_02840, partial [Alphaproteobacteria bacterium]
MEENKEILTKSEKNMEQSDKIHKTLGRIGLGGMALSSLVGLMYFWNHSSDDNTQEPVQDAPVAHTEKAQGESTKEAQPQKEAEKSAAQKATEKTTQKPVTGQAAKPVTETTPAGVREGASAEKGQTPTAAGQESGQAKPAEKILALPAFKPMKPACSISERNAHAKVKEGLNTVSSFSDTLDTIIVREVSSRLESGLGKGDALYNACLDIVSNI